MSLKIKFEEFCKAVNAGIITGELSFVFSLTEAWLEKYPNDIQATYFKARLDFLKNKNESGNKYLQQILEKNPEHLASYKLLITSKYGVSKRETSAFYLLTGEATDINAIYPWATTLRAVKKEIKRDQFVHAEKLLRNVIAEAPNSILVALEHARLVIGSKDQHTITQLLNIYCSRWEKCLQFNIWKAQNLLSIGKESEAVALLHTCSNLDPEGSVAKKLMGEDHEIISIFLDDRHIDFEDDIPTSIAITLDWNRLSAGVIKTRKTGVSNGQRKSEEKIGSETVDRVQSLSTEKIYVILSSYIGLRKKYGPKSADVIVENLHSLANAVTKNPRWKAIVFLPDEAGNVANYGLNTINTVDPWKVKLSLMDLNTNLKKSNQSIGAVLIVGNSEIIPFHRLPNPTEDSDKDVLSDNPYATSTSNYLLPEWLIGRLPGESGNDPGLLMEQIRHITDFHRTKQYKKGVLATLRNLKQRTRNFGRFLRELINPPNDFGYSAEVWRRSSIAAFRPIGKGADLRVSPPYEEETIDIDKLLQAKCAYFNLHGLSTTNEWYGQRDFSERSTGPDFPVAITADKLKNISNNIDLVFTEACFGGFVNGKKIDESIALKLLSIGSQGVVGSSCISYGSVFTPLIGGDLLGFIFWKCIKDGYSFGNALFQAKIGLVKVMMQRQGYLDGEDQKTILSFNLYGDPLGCLEEVIFLDGQKSESITESDLNLVSDTDGIAENPLSKQGVVSKDISEMLESYIPGLDNAKVRIRKYKVKVAKMIGQEKKDYSGTNLNTKILTQIVYEKSFVANKQTHQQYARLTMDASGKILKLAVSR